MILIASPRREIAGKARDALRADHMPAATVSTADEMKSLDPETVFSLILLCQQGKADNDLDELCRSLAISRNIPLVLLYSPSGAEDIMEHMEQDFSYRISSPVKAENLGRRLRFIIGLHKNGAGSNTTPDDICLQRHPRLIALASDLADSNTLARNLARSRNALLEKLARAETKIPDLTPDQQALLEDLPQAVANNQYELFFQPIVSLSENRISGFESLIRWNHPSRGMVRPDEFIPLAERSGIIHEMGDWVMNEACKYLSLAHERFPRPDPLTLSFNISPHQFVKPDLCDRIIKAADAYNIDHRNLRVEITESTIMTDMEASNLMLLTLKAHDFLLYMDDFGTGYSSLSYLRHFPVDVLKIDKSFVEWIHIDEESEMIVKTIIDLAHNLGMSVIAEGVESAEHLEKLRMFGCDYGQGYYFSRPIPVQKVVELLEKEPRW